MRKSEERTKVAILRSTIGVSAEEFAKMTGRTIHTVKSLESGRLKLSEDLADRIAVVTGVSTAWLFDDKRTGPPVRLDGNVVTRENAEYWYATIRAFWDKDARNAATSKGRIISDILQDILARDERKFWVAAYRADRFIDKLVKDFLTPKAEESERKRPARPKEEWATFFPQRGLGEAHGESSKSPKSVAESIRQQVEVWEETLKESAGSKKKRP